MFHSWLLPPHQSKTHVVEWSSVDGASITFCVLMFVMGPFMETAHVCSSRPVQSQIWIGTRFTLSGLSSRTSRQRPPKATMLPHPVLGATALVDVPRVSADSVLLTATEQAALPSNSAPVTAESG